jgi:hypothetical protein
MALETAGFARAPKLRSIGLDGVFISGPDLLGLGADARRDDGDDWRAVHVWDARRGGDS